MTQRGPLARESLELSVLETNSSSRRVVSFLRTQRIDACAYTGETEPGRRLELEDGLRA